MPFSQDFSLPFWHLPVFNRRPHGRGLDRSRSRLRHYRKSLLLFRQPQCPGRIPADADTFSAALFYRQKTAGQAFYLITACTLALCLLLTFSRGGLLGLLVAAVFFILLKDRRLIILLLIAALIGAAAMPDVFLQRFPASATRRILPQPTV